MVPYRGTSAPLTDATYPADLSAGADRVELDVNAFGQRWKIGRDLARGEAWQEAAD